MSKQYLVVDNGTFNVKAGFNSDNVSAPTKVLNAITRTRDGVIHIGNQYKTHSKDYSGIQIRRPFEQGNLTSWETEKPVWDYTLDQISKAEIDTSNTHLTLTETPFQLPQLSSNTDQIVFEEYEFGEYYRCIPASLVPFGVDESVINSDFSLVVDSGFNATWIVPVIYKKVHWEGVRKLPIGGNVLNGLLREVVSFRHYDMSDDPVLINTIKESTCFLAENFNDVLKNKQNYKCEFVLPDFKTTTTGFVKTKDTKVAPDTQLLALHDERFTVPESFYHPEIIFDLNGATASSSVLQGAPIKNLTDLVVSSIMSCPDITRPLLSANICLSGGTTNLPNFKTRLKTELTKELPHMWHVRVHDNYQAVPKDELAWHGGINLTNNDILEKISISKKEYFEHGSNWCQKQFGFKNV
ncbi:ARP6 [Candida metapsilosis]|uniref:Actin-like protein ARP6 n=1 Tax=Candida metapsilosis TaxID=273372 RepID=A0A8H7ZCS0_9ASCO|nr:ARP6 [Candida metapsilosis]